MRIIAMPISNITFIRSTATLLLLGLATLLGLVSMTGWLTIQTQVYLDEVFKGRQVRTALIEVRSLLQDTETGQRGYLLTQTESYLMPYEDGVARMGAALDRLTSLAPDDDRAAIGRLREVINQKLAELGETVELVQSGRAADALTVVRTDRGKNLMDEARTIFSDLLARVDGRLNSRMDAQDRSIQALKWATIGGALLITLVVGGSAWIVARYTRELIAARAELASTNSGLERRVADRTADLSRANEELQRFAYLVSHDLRSPLVNVMGFTSELEELRTQVFTRLADLKRGTGTGEHSGADDDQLGREFDEAIGFIKASIDKMDGLIAAILKLSRDGQRALLPELLDMRTIIESAAANVQHRLTQKGGHVELVGEFPRMHADRVAVEQIFGNLLDNAVKYSEPSRAPHIVVTGRASGDRVEFCVADNGRGIAATDQERVFELFRRSGRRDQPGDGIGLAHVRASVRRLGGDIGLTSTPGEGSTFKVLLPSTDAPE